MKRKEYYKIGEISTLYGIGADSLRYYEEIGILKPRRDSNGYRMYSICLLYTSAKGLRRIVVYFYHQSVGAGRYSRHSHRFNQISFACGVARVDDHRQVGQVCLLYTSDLTVKVSLDILVIILAGP